MGQIQSGAELRAAYDQTYVAGTVLAVHDGVHDIKQRLTDLRELLDRVDIPGAEATLNAAQLALTALLQATWRQHPDVADVLQGNHQAPPMDDHTPDDAAWSRNAHTDMFGAG